MEEYFGIGIGIGMALWALGLAWGITERKGKRNAGDAAVWVRVALDHKTLHPTYYLVLDCSCSEFILLHST